MLKTKNNEEFTAEDTTEEISTAKTIKAYDIMQKKRISTWQYVALKRIQNWNDNTLISEEDLAKALLELKTRPLGK